MVNTVGTFYDSTGMPIQTDDLQSLVELQYVLVGNTEIAYNLNSLQSALGVTQNIITTLTSLQNLHNMISVPSVGILANVGSTFTGSVPKAGLSLTYTVPTIVSAIKSYLKTGGGSDTLNTMLSASGLLKLGVTAYDVAYQYFGSTVQGLNPKTGVIGHISLQDAFSLPANGTDLLPGTANQNSDWTEGLYYPHSSLLSAYLTDVQFSTGKVNSGTAFNMNIDGPTQPGGTVNQGTGFATRYAAAASAFFGAPINPIVATELVSTIAEINAISSMRVLKANLMSEMIALKGMTGVAASGGPESILGTLSAVYNGIPSGMVSGTASGNLAQYGLFANWILDNYNAATNAKTVNVAGQVQNNLTDAITASQNLNNSQQESVRNYMFQFQEFYQSASAVLQALTQIISKMAQNIQGS